MIVIEVDGIPLVEIEGRVGLRQKEPLAGIARGFDFILSEMQPGGLGAMHAHEGREHVLFVLEGSLSVRTPDGSREARRGDLVYFAPGEPHEIRNTGHVPTRYLVLYVPSRK